MQMKNCWNCGEKPAYQGTQKSGFVECVNVDCNCCGPTSIQAIAVRRWNYLIDSINELKNIKERMSKGAALYPITQIQEDVLMFIAQHIEDDEKNRPPTLRGISKGMNKNIGSITKHVTALVKKGYLKRTFNKTRGLEVVRLPE